MVPRGAASDDEHMDESTSKLVQTEEEVFADEVSDEELGRLSHDRGDYLYLLL